jgi:hypothetical protein
VISSECPCGRARSGCTYHDPTLQPALAEPCESDSWGDPDDPNNPLTFHMPTFPHEPQIGDVYFSPLYGPICVVMRADTEASLFACTVHGGRAQVWFEILDDGTVTP